ncbi:MAG TPA: alpha/beta hydrolase [Cyclobacteriaceae bacterium]|nr:alpha/beta hydrolase [Cyclobacteriaceae bacterium]
MKQKILFIHSAGPQGSHNGSDFLLAYLYDHLFNTHELFHPYMPDPENPHYDAWRITIKKELDILSNNTLLIGHSLGASTLLKYLSESFDEKAIGGLFLIAAPYWGTDDWNVDEYVLTKNFSSNLRRIPDVFLYHSKDDEVVPIRHLTHYADEMPWATVRVCEGGGHLFGHGLPELITDIKSLT